MKVSTFFYILGFTATSSTLWLSVGIVSGQQLTRNNLKEPIEHRDISKSGFDQHQQHEESPDYASKHRRDSTRQQVQNQQASEESNFHDEGYGLARRTRATTSQAGQVTQSTKTQSQAAPAAKALTTKRQSKSSDKDDDSKSDESDDDDDADEDDEESATTTIAPTTSTTQASKAKNVAKQKAHRKKKASTTASPSTQTKYTTNSTTSTTTARPSTVVNNATNQHGNQHHRKKHKQHAILATTLAPTGNQHNNAINMTNSVAGNTTIAPVTNSMTTPTIGNNLLVSPNGLVNKIPTAVPAMHNTAPYANHFQDSQQTTTPIQQSNSINHVLDGSFTIAVPLAALEPIRNELLNCSSKTGLSDPRSANNATAALTRRISDLVVNATLNARNKLFGNQQHEHHSMGGTLLAPTGLNPHGLPATSWEQQQSKLGPSQASNLTSTIPGYDKNSNDKQQQLGATINSSSSLDGLSLTSHTSNASSLGNSNNLLISPKGSGNIMDNNYNGSAPLIGQMSLGSSNMMTNGSSAGINNNDSGIYNNHLGNNNNQTVELASGKGQLSRQPASNTNNLAGHHAQLSSSAGNSIESQMNGLRKFIVVCSVATVLATSIIIGLAIKFVR